MSTTNGTRCYRVTYGSYTPPVGPTTEQLAARARGVAPSYVLWSMSGGAVHLGFYPTVEAAEAKMHAFAPFVRMNGGVRVEEGEHVLYVYPGNMETVWFAIERSRHS